jgi:hypothetical protein
MAILGAVVGDTGTGKSTSLKNLDPNETFIINVAGKPLPFRGWKSKYKKLYKNEEGIWSGNIFDVKQEGDGAAQIEKMLSFIDKSKDLANIKNIIIDDSQYIMSFESMDRVNETGYTKFTAIAKHFYEVLKKAMNMREDLKVFLLCHEENDATAENPHWKIKTTGKLIDTAINIEGLLTYVLFTARIKDEEDTTKMNYVFQTNSMGENTAKTPEGCFDTLYIPNDLSIVFKKIDEYNYGD